MADWSHVRVKDCNRCLLVLGVGRLIDCDGHGADLYAIIIRYK